MAQKECFLLPGFSLLLIFVS
uniref:Uncharacterized protein n=1 Tax=Arundo donax TaxID=35708 RepID=A0A0A9BRL4_ARUDO